MLHHSSFIGIDQALANSGLALYSEQDQSIFVSCLRTNSKDQVGDRLSQIETYLKDLIEILDKPKIFYEYVYSGKFVPYESIKVLGLVEKIIAEYKLSSECFRSNAKEKGSWRSILEVSNQKKDLQTKLNLQGKFNHNISDAIGILGAGLVTDGIISLESIYKLEIKNLTHVKQGSSKSVLQCIRNL